MMKWLCTLGYALASVVAICLGAYWLSTGQPVAGSIETLAGIFFAVSAVATWKTWESLK